MHSALKYREPGQIIDKLMKFVVDPGYANFEGENLIHLAAQNRDCSVLQAFFETYDCTSALGMITKRGYCALNYAVRNKLDSNVEFLVKKYAEADVRTIRLIVQNALQRNSDDVLEVMRQSQVFSGYLREEQSEQKPLIQGSIDCMGAIDECETTMPYRITGEYLLNVAGNEDVIMEDAA